MRQRTDGLENEFRKQLTKQHGPLLGGSALYQALAFPTAAAMRQAEIRGEVGVRLFNIPNRRGKFALTNDVAAWLAKCAALPESDAGKEGAAPIVQSSVRQTAESSILSENPGQGGARDTAPASDAGGGSDQQ